MQGGLGSCDRALPVQQILESGMPNFDDPGLATQIMRNLADPEYIKRIAYGVVLFPDISDCLFSRWIRKAELLRSHFMRSQEFSLLIVGTIL
ncbi:MAG: hypothetical protein KME13_22510 [Myxacorys californica WJT36-NPBG1]|jgi:hypothetical protein|nr:hypothetical protein [Myxacorys californica WJT36-NPBG1]